MVKSTLTNGDSTGGRRTHIIQLSFTISLNDGTLRCGVADEMRPTELGVAPGYSDHTGSLDNIDIAKTVMKFCVIGVMQTLSTAYTSKEGAV